MSELLRPPFISDQTDGDEKMDMMRAEETGEEHDMCTQLLAAQGRIINISTGEKCDTGALNLFTT